MKIYISFIVHLLDTYKSMCYNLIVSNETLLHGAVAFMNNTIPTLLESLFLFKNLDFESLDSKYNISLCCQIKNYAAGEKILLTNADGEHFLAVVSCGKIRLTARIKQKEATLKYAGNGEVFGAASLLNNMAPAESTAECDSEVILIPSSLILKLISDNSTAALNYLNFLSQKISFLNREIAIFAAGSAEDKLATHLYLLSSASVNISVESMSSLASQLGISRASLYRAVENLTAVNAISYDGKNFTVLNRQKLIEY